MYFLFSVAANCSTLGSGRFPTTLCYQYLECAPVLWYYGNQTVNCTTGFAFNASLQNCEADSTCIQ